MPYIIVYNSQENYNGIIMESLDAFCIKVQEYDDIILLMLLSSGISRTTQAWAPPVDKDAMGNPTVIVFTRPSMGWLSKGGSMASED